MLNTVVRAKPKPVRVPRKKRSKRDKRVHRRALEKTADSLCKQIVLLRDKFCVCPAPKNGHSQVMQAGHLITRTKESVKFDLRNVALQCSSCNLLHEHRPERYTRWFVETYGAGEYAALVTDSEAVRKLTVDELGTLCVQLSDIHQCQLNDKAFKPRFTQKEILTGEWRRGLRPGQPDS